MVFDDARGKYCAVPAATWNPVVVVAVVDPSRTTRTFFEIACISTKEDPSGTEIDTAVAIEPLLPWDPLGRRPTKKSFTKYDAISMVVCLLALTKS